MMMRALLCAILGLLACLAPAQAPVTALKSVVADGVGAGPDRGKARDDALADAQRRAVEEAVGLYIESETVVKNGAVLSDDIYAHSQGYVQHYAILNEQYDGDEYRVKIRAQVRMGKLEDDLTDVSARLHVAGSPRVLVDLRQPQACDDPTLAQTLVTEKLVALGFTVLDADQLANNKSKEAMKLLREGKYDAARILALQDVADILIIGEAKYRTARNTVANTEMFSGEAWLNAKAIRVDTAHIVAAWQGKTPFAVAAFAENNAAESALTVCAQDWLTKNLGLLIRAAVDPARGYIVTLTGCGMQDVSAVERQLADLRFVRRTRLLGFDRGVARLEVLYTKTVKDLAAAMTAFTAPKLVVDSATTGTVRASVKR
ncbi:MAG TPA: hypothetical protein PLZ36_13775 [Armatimonadota bacterium]|nr:hypothetical protein [Armatimonadota bacterium]